MSVREQGSASWLIAILAVTAIGVGAFLLTVLMPVQQAFRDSALWSAETSVGAGVFSMLGGMWSMFGLIIIIGITIFVWVHTRQ